MLPALPRVLVLVALAVLAAALAGPGAAQVPQPLPVLGSPLAPAPCADLCPDMTVDGATLNPFLGTINYASTHCAVQEGMTPPGPQRVVRFTTALPNEGPGDLVVGTPAANPENFYYSACHGHYHTKDYADYRLWEPADYDAYRVLRLTHPFFPADDLLAMLAPEQQPVSGFKAGFCVIDVRPSTSPLGRVLSALNPPKFGCGNMGVTAGWADVYGAGILGQWVVITDVAPGEYVLDVEVNANHHYQELNYWNNSVTKSVTVT